MRKITKYAIALLLLITVACSDDDTSDQVTNEKTFRVEIEPLIESTDIERIGIVFQIPNTDANLDINGTFELIENNVGEFKQYEIEFTNVDNTITIETTETVEKPIAFTMVLFLNEQNTGPDFDALNFKAFANNTLFNETNVQVFTNLEQGIFELEFNNW
jgi:hypothetical protein